MLCTIARIRQIIPKGDTPKAVASLIQRCPQPDELRALLSERIRDTRILRHALRMAERLQREIGKGGDNVR